MNNRQNNWRVIGNHASLAGMASARVGVALISAATALGAYAGARAQSGARAVSPESALELMQHGDCSGAMAQLDALRRTSTADKYLAALTGSFLLDSGDLVGASLVFRAAISRSPTDSVVNYGLAISEIGTGDLAGAEHSLKACEETEGDPEAIRAARRYIRFLRGDVATQSASNGSVNDFALDGITALRAGRYREAAQLLQKAVTGGTGDPFLQSEGPLMSFDGSKAIASAFEIVKTAREAGTAERDQSGDLLLSPEEVPRGASYAAYELDGEALSIVGTRPFSYTWDSRRVANGRHKIAIVLYNAAGDEISRSERTVRVSNSGFEGGAPASARDTRLRAMLWMAVALKPDRCACAYSAGSAFSALGDKANARIWFARAAAIRADYRDTCTRLRECGGLNRPGATVYCGRSDEMCVALTFDDGPKPGVTEPLLDVLVTAHVPATFFVIGKHIQEYPELARAISAAGMEIENHSYTHRSLTTLTSREAEQEMLETQAAILAVTGRMPRYIRPPGGNWNNRVAAAARQWGLTPCMWSVDVFDAEIIGAQKVAETVLSQVKPGSIILMHNGKVSTLQALPTILRVLRTRGFRFVTVEELSHRLASAPKVHGIFEGESRRAHTE